MVLTTDTDADAKWFVYRTLNPDEVEIRYEEQPLFAWLPEMQLAPTSCETNVIGVGKYRPPSWFADALRENEAGRIDVALDIVYDKIDNWMSRGHYAACGAFLRSLSVEELPTRIILAIAVTTRPASDEIPQREEFFDRAWNALKMRNKNPEKLLGKLRVAAHLTPRKRPSAIRRFLGLY